MGDDKDVKQDVWVGFDLGGTKMLAVILDENLKPLGRKRRKTRGHEGIEAGFERIEETIEKAFKDADVDPARLRGIGIGCPGILDLKKGIINEAPNLGWENAAICSYLNKKFDVPVVLLNDVDAGLYGEFQFGAAKDAHNALGIFPGTGIGGAVYLRGKNSSRKWPFVHGDWTYPGGAEWAFVWMRTTWMFGGSRQSPGNLGSHCASRLPRTSSVCSRTRRHRHE